MSRPSRSRASSSRTSGFDTRKFQTMQQFENWSTYYQNRPLRKEAEVVVTDFPGHPVIRYFHDLGWESMLSLNGRVNVSWVKEFYANMDKNRSTAFEFHSWVRGFQIIIDADFWSEFLGIGRPDQPIYPFELLGDDAAPVDYDGIAAFLTSRPYAWPSGLLPYSLMQPIYRLLNLIVCHTIEPRGHHTDINQERGYVLFAIAAGRPIDLPAFMVQQMGFTGYTPRTAGMPFGVLLTRFMESRRIPAYGDDTIVEVRKKINAQTVNQSEAHLPRDNIVPAPVYIDDTLTMEERMENLEAAVVGGFEHMAQQHTEMYGQLNTLTESMQRLEMSNAQSNAQMAEMLEWMRRQG